MQVFKNGRFLLVFLSYLVNAFGDWLNYVAALVVLADVAPASSRNLLTSLFMVVRLLPPLIFSTITGTIADSYPKKTVMAVCNVISAVVVLGFLLVSSTSLLWLFFVVAFLQQSLFAQYDPTRRALVPEVVRGEEELKSATTADAFAWSIMMAVGAASGGALVATLGKDWNFVIDAGTYLLSAALIMAVRSERGADHAGGGSGSGEVHSGFWDATAAGAKYLCGAEQRGLLAVLFVKATASVNWGMSELLEVELASSSSFHQFGGFSTTLGLIYAATGLGCVVGPVFAGAMTGSSEVSFQRALVGAFGVSVVSALLLVVANSVVLVLVAAFLRACGSSVIWIYSTLIVQRRADPLFFGRIFAAEMCYFTAFKCGGLVLSGVLVDKLSFTAKATAAVMLAISTASFFAYALFFRGAFLRGGGSRSDAPAPKVASGEAAPLLLSVRNDDEHDDDLKDVDVLTI